MELESCSNLGEEGNLVALSRPQYVYKGRKEIRCRGCNELVPLLISWSNQNPGRRYYGCPNFRNGCRDAYFEWFDEPSSDWISRLLREFRDSERRLAKENGALRKNISVSHCIEESSSVQSVCRQSVFRGKGGSEGVKTDDEDSGVKMKMKMKKWKSKFTTMKSERDVYRLLFITALVYMAVSFLFGKVGRFSYNMLNSSV